MQILEKTCIKLLEKCFACWNISQQVGNEFQALVKATELNVFSSAVIHVLTVSVNCYSTV